MSIDRYQDDRGAWTYRDQKESEFVLEMMAFGIPMDSIDDVIDGLQLAQLRDNERAELLDERRQALSVYLAGDFEHAKALATALHRSCRFAGLHLAAVPLARVGRKFRDGRKPNTGGPIRKAIARLLKQNPDTKNADLWNTLAAHPPKGWQFFDNRAGKYIEGPKGGDGMNYARFCNIASEEKRNLKG